MADDGRPARLTALRASAHPVRLRMLSLLTGSAMSAAEVARELGLTHANASYHLRRLLDAGQLVLDGEETIRGGRAKRYRYPHERQGASERAGDPDPGPHPDEVVAYGAVLSHELQRRVRRLEPGVGMHSDLEGWVEPDAWERACRLLLEASHLLHRANRPARTPGTVHVSATAWAFRMSEEPR